MAKQKIKADLEVDGTVTADSLIKKGGTSSQYLMADGSIKTFNPSVIQVKVVVKTTWSNDTRSSVSSDFLSTQDVTILSTTAELYCKTSGFAGYTVGDTANIINGQYPLDGGRTSGQGITISWKNSDKTIIYYGIDTLTIQASPFSIPNTNNDTQADATFFGIRFTTFYIDNTIY
jgi:hypothetical protein